MAKRVKYKAGALVAIPLPTGQFAYARAYKDAEFGVFGIVSDQLLSAEQLISKPIVFFHAANDDAITAGTWPVIGLWPFKSEDEAWAPAKATCYVRETNEWTMGGVPRIDHKGQMRVATLEEVQGMDILSVSHRPELFVQVILDRLVNGNHANYKVRSS